MSASGGDLLDAPVTEQLAAIERREISAGELLAETARRIAGAAELNAVVTPWVLEAAEIAERFAALVASGAPRPPLAGVPFTVKDTIEVAGVRSTGGSVLLADHHPRASAPVVDQVVAAGGVFVGKTNSPEFGMGNLDTWNLLFGQTRNPRDLTRSPGGSSGGEAAAVAAGLSGFGIGTDFGGSVRFPAHCTGIAALRPTPGTLSNAGVIPFHPANDLPGVRRSVVQRAVQTVGFLARSAADLEILYRVTTATAPVAAPMATLRCAWLTDLAGHRLRSDIAAAIESAAKALAERGVVAIDKTPPGFDGLPDLMAEWRSLDDLDEIASLAAGREDELTPLVRDDLAARQVTPRPGAEALQSAVADARERIGKFMARFPLLLMPVAAEPAFEIVDPPSRAPREAIEAYCRVVSLLGLPAVVVPAGTSVEGLPIGVQLVGRRGRDREVLLAAMAIEAAIGRWSAPTGRAS